MSVQFFSPTLVVTPLVIRAMLSRPCLRPAMHVLTVLFRSLISVRSRCIDVECTVSVVNSGFMLILTLRVNPVARASRLDCVALLIFPIPVRGVTGVGSRSVLTLLSFLDSLTLLCSALTLLTAHSVQPRNAQAWSILLPQASRENQTAPL